MIPAVTLSELCAEKFFLRALGPLSIVVPPFWVFELISWVGIGAIAVAVGAVAVGVGVGVGVGIGTIGFFVVLSEGGGWCGGGFV